LSSTPIPSEANASEERDDGIGDNDAAIIKIDNIVATTTKKLPERVLFFSVLLFLMKR
jgi:hypothetical protein